LTRSHRKARKDAFVREGLGNDRNRSGQSVADFGWICGYENDLHMKSIDQTATKRGAARSVRKSKIDQRHIRSRRMCKRLFNRGDRADRTVSGIGHDAFELQRNDGLVFNYQNPHATPPSEPDEIEGASRMSRRITLA
jgi:hypothetical protein